MVAVALLFSLTHSAVQNRKSVKSEGGSEKSAGPCSSCSSGLAMSAQEPAFLGSAPSAGEKKLFLWLERRGCGFLPLLFLSLLLTLRER